MIIKCKIWYLIDNLTKIKKIIIIKFIHGVTPINDTTTLLTEIVTYKIFYHLCFNKI